MYFTFTRFVLLDLSQLFVFPNTCPLSLDRWEVKFILFPGEESISKNSRIMDTCAFFNGIYSTKGIISSIVLIEL